jgi:hypothetical protein
MAMIDKITSATLAVAMFILLLLSIFVVGVMIYGLTHQKFDCSCAYCHGTITEGADYVCMTDGRRMHAECYMRAIREDTNNVVR